jgi:long-chain acyl-CoA synthetase
MPFITGKTITEIFRRRAEATPHLVGYQFKDNASHDWKTATFREFYAEVKSVTYGLVELGVEPGDRVAILSNTRYEWSMCDMAVLGARAVSVAIYPSSTLEDVAYILNNSGAKFLIAENEKQVEKIKSLQNYSGRNSIPFLEKVVVIDPYQGILFPLLAEIKIKGRDEEIKQPKLFETHLAQALPSDLIAIAYTSGTTGVPKGAMLTHDNMVSVLEDALAIFSNFSEPESEVVLSFLPFSHIFGKVESVATHVFGWKQAFAEDLDKLLTYLNDVKPTMLLCVPRTFEKAYERIQAKLEESSPVTKKLYAWGMAVGKRYHETVRAKKLPRPRDFAEYALAKKLVFSKISEAFGGRLRFAICGGAPLQKELGEFFQIAGIKILEGYGLTETAGPITVNWPDEPRFGTVGRPMAEVNLRIADDGEIEVRSRKVFVGYYPEQETERTWFKTGDIGFLDEDGFLHITSRKKDIVVTSGGKNIAPQKIESLVDAHPLIHQMVVLGDRRPYLVALLTLNREKVIQLASERNLLFSEYQELVKNPKIIALIQQAIDTTNRSLAPYETIKKFMILPADFTVEGGELTPSLKLKRRVVEMNYKSQIDSLYLTSVTRFDS